MTIDAGTSAHVGAARVTTSVPRDAHMGAADVTALTDGDAHVGVTVDHAHHPGDISGARCPEYRGRSSSLTGAAPMEWLFSISAEHWAHQSAHIYSWQGLALYGVDGPTLRVPDSSANQGTRSSR
jgi:hypothetical protein